MNFHIFLYCILKLQTQESMYKDVGTEMAVGFTQAGSHFSVPQHFLPHTLGTGEEGGDRLGLQGSDHLAGRVGFNFLHPHYATQRLLFTGKHSIKEKSMRKEIKQTL